ncbi:MAG: hypothetical protein JXA57_09270 [Armatimonadetes bacterium]|nr:hypothetical protein [Armatimonadota bacterium]
MASRGLKHPLLVVGVVLAAAACLLAATTAPAAAAPTAVGGTITQNTTWQDEILVTDDVQVPSGVTLTILPGTQMEFQHYRGYRDPTQRLRMNVKGSIVAAATASQPIYFTSDAADQG